MPRLIYRCPADDILARTATALRRAGTVTSASLDLAGSAVAIRATRAYGGRDDGQPIKARASAITYPRRILRLADMETAGLPPGKGRRQLTR